jgi:phosphoglycolate phosphatase
MNATLKAMGHAEWAMDEMKGRVALSMRDSFPALFGERWPEARDIFYRTFTAIHIEHLRPLPGAGEMLERLAALGVRLGVVSNKNSRFLREEVHHLGWQHLFDRLVGATDAEQDKPAVAPVLLALSASGILPGEEVWFVGDAAVDMECAIRSGCVPVLMRLDADREGEFDGFPPRCRVGTCGELADLIERLQGAAPLLSRGGAEDAQASRREDD